MLVEATVESASVKRGSDAAADIEERARLRLRAEGKRGHKHVARRIGTPGQDEGQARAEEGVRSVKGTATSPTSGGRSHADSSCREWLRSDSGRLALEC